MTRALFPPTLTLPGEGDVVLVDARGRRTDEVVESLNDLPERSIIITDDPRVGELRAAGVTYEFIPSATPDGRHAAEALAERLTWIHYVYGIDRSMPLPVPTRRDGPLADR